MTFIKKLLCAVLLFTVTVVTVMLPEVLSRYRIDRRTQKIYSYTLNTSNYIKLTSDAVARLFCNISSFNGFTTNPSSSVILNNSEYTQDGISDNINSLFETVFSNNTELCNYFKSVIDNSIPNCTREYILTVYSDLPVALSIINVSYKSEFEYFDFSFEEKTGTLINLSYISFSEVMSNKYDTVLSENDMQSALEKYCIQTLKLSKHNFTLEAFKEKTDLAYERGINFFIHSDMKNSFTQKETDIQN